jgi:type I restriction enzyme S subunit
VTSGSRDWSKYYADHGALFVRTQDINQNTLAPTEYIARVALPQRVEGKRTLIAQGDLLITITGANVGKCALVDIPIPEAYVSQSVALVRLAKGFSGRFIQRQLTSPSSGDDRTLLQQSAYGVGRPVLNLDNVRELPICFAPLNEQTRIIAAIEGLLSSVNSAREHLSRVPAILKRFRQAVLAAACSGRMTEDWRTANGISDPWSECVMGEVADFVGGFAYKSPTFTSTGKHQVIRIGNVRPFALNLSASPVFIPDQIAQETNRFRLSDGDIVLSMTGTKFKRDYGFAAIVNCTDRPLFLNQRVGRLRCKPSVLPMYLLYFLQTDSFRDFFFQGETGNVNQGNVGADGIRKAPISLPTIHEQQEVVRRVQTLLQLAESVEARLNASAITTEMLTQSILARAFRGELVPTEAELARREGREYEPASVLLEKIRKERASLPDMKRKQIGA